MKKPPNKVPQRKPHSLMSGEELLNKLAGEAQKGEKPNPLAPVYKPPPKKV